MPHPVFLLEKIFVIFRCERLVYQNEWIVLSFVDRALAIAKLYLGIMKFDVNRIEEQPISGQSGSPSDRTDPETTWNNHPWNS